MMSFSNYDNFQGQPAPEDSGAPGAPTSQPQQHQMGQPMENSSGQYQGAAPGVPGGLGVDQQGSDSKTTLWYVEMFCENYIV